MGKLNNNNVIGQFSKFSKTFWIANTMELFERWAFYGFFMLFANYLTLSTDTGALGLSQTQKGIIMGVGTAILYLLPIITGAIADRIGFKKTLFIAYSIYLVSFIIMPFCRSFMAVFINYLFLALGASLFKPIISATVARTTTKETSSIGFGIFYMMVNIGAFIGPLVALQFSESAFQMVFYVSAALIGVNLFVLLFYKEPERDSYTDTFWQSILRIFKNIRMALSDLKLVVFLIIVAGFWTMYYQLFFSLSVFITQWVDTQVIYENLQVLWPWLIEKIGSPDKTIKAEYFTNMDALFIIAFQLIVSTIVMKWRPINSIITGFVISSIGMGLALMTNNGFFLVFALFIFGIGEMSGSPKITEYIGRIAPKDKVALYMGCSFLPVFLGSFFAGIVAGPVYQKLADKVSFIKLEFLERNIHLPEGMTQNDLFAKATNDFGMTAQQLNSFLWDKYHPSNIWYVVSAIGLTAALSMWLYDKYLLKSTNNKEY
ncbi:MAG: MFS transporter [Salinivirgaceae bacterium]